MKRLKYFLIEYKYDILGPIAIIVISYLGYHFRNDYKNIFIGSIIVSFIFLILIIFFRLRGRSFFYIPLTLRKDRDNWFGDGIFEYSRMQKSFRITKSSAGFIYSECLLWSDYSIGFEFKILNNCLGFILRAVNLSNYIMLQIRINGIRPHIKINGNFRAWEHKDVGLSFENNLSFEKWYKCLINCDKGIIKIKILDKKEIVIDREWRIHKDDIVYSYPVKLVKQKDNSKSFELVDEEKKRSVIITYPVTLNYGSIGFRNTAKEEALVKNVLIQKL